MDKGFYIRNRHGKHCPRFIGANRVAAARRLNEVDVHPGEWVDRYYGPDVMGVEAWANVDYHESLIDMLLELR